MDPTYAVFCGIDVGKGEPPVGAPRGAHRRQALEDEQQPRHHARYPAQGAM